MMEPIINIQEVAGSFETRIENEVLHAIRKIGVDVDKERLIRALEDARSFYDEGYAAGVKAAERHGRWIAYLDGDHIMPERYYRCSECGRVERRKEPYCHCGAKMDGVEA